MNSNGIIIGLATFLIIGLFHPIVIKAEYYFGKRCWWAFALAGVIFGVLSLYIENVLWSSISGVTAFSSFWSIHELIEQEKRVKKGWFPENPKRKNSYLSNSLDTVQLTPPESSGDTSVALYFCI